MLFGRFNNLFYAKYITLNFTEPVGKDFQKTSKYKVNFSLKFSSQYIISLTWLDKKTPVIQFHFMKKFDIQFDTFSWTEKIVLHAFYTV